MQPVKPHSTAFDQGQQLAMNSPSVSKAPPVHSLLPLSALTHSRSLAHCSSSLPLAGRSPGASLCLGLGSMAESRILAAHWHVCPIGLALWQLHSSLKYLSSFSSSSSSPFCQVHLPYKQQGQCRKLPDAIASLRTVGFLPDEECLRVLGCVLQGLPTFKGNSKSWGGLSVFSRLTHSYFLLFLVEKSCAKITVIKSNSSWFGFFAQ